MNKATILKYVLNCFLFFVLPLLMMVFGNRLPPPLLFENFSKGIPPVIEYGETIFRYAVMILAVFMPLQISTPRQKVGLAIYIVGVILYVLSWVPLILFPQSAWSTSWIGFSAMAYTPLIWLIGIGLVGDSFYFPIPYKPWYYILLSTVFVIFHMAHTILVYVRTY